MLVPYQPCAETICVEVTFRGKHLQGHVHMQVTQKYVQQGTHIVSIFTISGTLSYITERKSPLLLSVVIRLNRLGFMPSANCSGATVVSRNQIIACNYTQAGDTHMFLVTSGNVLAIM